MQRRISLLVFLLFVSCQLPFFSQRTTNVHLVIDAGSSGTRFCPYEVDEQCNHLDVSQNCFSVQASGGLADLKLEEINQVMNQGFQKLEGIKIEKAIILGTGGFRRLPAYKQKQQIDLIRSSAISRFPDTEVRVLTGKQEAQLAYLAMVAFRNGKTDHKILETGGATIQIAGWEWEPASAPAGLNAMRELSGPPTSCAEDTNPSPQRFQECQAALRKVLRAQPWFSAFFRNDKPESVYALGSSWKSIFTLAGDSEISQEDLRKQGTQICNSRIKDIVDAGVPEKFAPASCYLHSYQYVLASELNINELKAGDGSWPPGAAISDFFSGCTLRAH